MKGACRSEGPMGSRGVDQGHSGKAHRSEVGGDWARNGTVPFRDMLIHLQEGGGGSETHHRFLEIPGTHNCPTPREGLRAC